MNTRKLSAVSFLAAAVLALGCAAGDGGLSELEENRALWESHGISDYTIEVEGVDGVPTVTSLFGNIERALEVGAAIEVEYNEDYGYPESSVALDPQDAGYGFEVTYIQFDLVSPDGELVIPPSVASPRLPPQPPGFDEFAEGTVADVPPSNTLLKDLDGANLDFAPEFPEVER